MYIIIIKLKAIFKLNMPSIIKRICKKEIYFYCKHYQNIIHEICIK